MSQTYLGFQSDYFHPYYSELDGFASITANASEYDGMAFDDVENTLKAMLVQALENAGAPDLPAPTMTNATLKWRLVSAIQKSIRRGDVNHAVHPAIAMENSTEAKALWRRLAVCALEDIGFANPELVALVLTMATQPGWRSKHGGVPLTAFIVDRMAMSLKSRTLCHLACLVGATDQPDVVEAGTHWVDIDMEDPDVQAHLQRFLTLHPDPEVGPPTDGAALVPWMLSSRASKALAGDLNYVLPGQGKVKDPKRKYSNGSGLIHEKAMEAYESYGYEKKKLPTLWRYVIRKARSMGLEGLVHGIPALYPAMSNTPLVIRKEVLPPIEILRKVPSVTFDKHTFEGKRAIALFGKQCEPVRDFLEMFVEEGLRSAALGSAVFYAEGGEPMAAILESIPSTMIQRSEHCAFARRYGLTPDRFDELHDVVRKHIGDLNDARRTVLA